MKQSVAINYGGYLKLVFVLTPPPPFGWGKSKVNGRNLNSKNAPQTSQHTTSGDNYY